MPARSALLVRCSSSQNDSKSAVCCVGLRATAADIKVHNVLTIRSKQVQPDRQPASNLINARFCVSIDRQNASAGKIEKRTTFVWSIVLVSLIAGCNSKICSCLRFDPGCYPMPLILNEAVQPNSQGMHAILKRDEPQYGMPGYRRHSHKDLRINSGYAKPRKSRVRKGRQLSFPQAMQSQRGHAMKMGRLIGPIASKRTRTRVRQLQHKPKRRTLLRKGEIAPSLFYCREFGAAA